MRYDIEDCSRGRRREDQLKGVRGGIAVPSSITRDEKTLSTITSVQSAPSTIVVETQKEQPDEGKARHFQARARSSL